MFQLIFRHVLVAQLGPKTAAFPRFRRCKGKIRVKKAGEEKEQWRLQVMRDVVPLQMQAEWFMPASR